MTAKEKKDLFEQLVKKCIDTGEMKNFSIWVLTLSSLEGVFGLKSGLPSEKVNKK